MATATFQQGVSGYTGCLDTFLNDGTSAAVNFENNGTIQAKSVASANFSRVILISFDLSSLSPTNTVTNASLQLTCNAAGTVSGTMYLMRLLRPDWVVTQATWNNYKTGSAWNTAGARGNGTDINGDWTDGVPGAVGVFSVSATDVIGTKKTFAGITQSTIQAALGGTLHFAIHQALNANANAGFYDTTAASTSNRALLTVNYDPPVVGGTAISRRTTGLFTRIGSRQVND